MASSKLGADNVQWCLHKQELLPGNLKIVYPLEFHAMFILEIELNGGMPFLTPPTHPLGWGGLNETKGWFLSGWKSRMQRKILGFPYNSSFY